MIIKPYISHKIIIKKKALSLSQGLIILACVLSYFFSQQLGLDKGIDDLQDLSAFSRAHFFNLLHTAL